MSNTSSTSNKVNVPEARAALEQFKYEVANEIGVPLKKGYNGDLTSAQNGYVGGYMVKKMIEAQERQMAGKQACLKKRLSPEEIGLQKAQTLYQQGECKNARAWTAEDEISFAVHALCRI